MASRRCEGLYLVGEMLDVDGRIGGFNFQWAWSTAYLAGRALAARYTLHLRGVAGLQLPFEPDWARSNWQTYAVRVPATHQRAIMQTLLDSGIATRRGVMNAHREAAYPPSTWRAAGTLDQSEAAQQSAIALPLFHDLTEADQDRVLEVPPQQPRRDEPQPREEQHNRRQLEDEDHRQQHVLVLSERVPDHRLEVHQR